MLPFPPSAGNRYEFYGQFALHFKSIGRTSAGSRPRHLRRNSGLFLPLYFGNRPGEVLCDSPIEPKFSFWPEQTPDCSLWASLFPLPVWFCILVNSFPTLVEPDLFLCYSCLSPLFAILPSFNRSFSRIMFSFLACKPEVYR